MRLLKEIKKVQKGQSVVYWMRMEDVRSTSCFGSYACTNDDVRKLRTIPL